MSLDEQHRASEIARHDAEYARDCLSNLRNLPKISDQGAALMAIGSLLLAIEARLNYGGQSILDGTISCRICRVILLQENADGHYAWHEEGQR